MAHCLTQCPHSPRHGSERPMTQGICMTKQLKTCHRIALQVRARRSGLCPWMSTLPLPKVVCDFDTPLQQNIADYATNTSPGLFGAFKCAPSESASSMSMSSATSGSPSPRKRELVLRSAKEYPLQRKEIKDIDEITTLLRDLASLNNGQVIPYGMKVCFSPSDVLFGYQLTSQGPHQGTRGFPNPFLKDAKVDYGMFIEP